VGAIDAIEPIDAAVDDAALAVGLGQVLDHIACSHHVRLVSGHSLFFLCCHLCNELVAESLLAESEQVREKLNRRYIFHCSDLSLDIEFGLR